MKDIDTLTVSKVGQSVLPKWWRDKSGMKNGGIVEVRPLHDGLNSIILTPKSKPKRGLTGKELMKIMSKCPHPMPVPERHILPFK